VERGGRARARPPSLLLHEWIRTWWDSFGADRDLHIIVVRDEGRVVAIAPLMRESAIVYAFRCDAWRLLANDHTPRTDFIVADRHDEAYRSIWNTLAEEIDDWDVLQLTQLLRGIDDRRRDCRVLQPRSGLRRARGRAATRRTSR